MDYLFVKTALAYNAHAQTFENPLGSADTVAEVIAKIVGSLYIFAIPIASIFILWGAFQILMSAGEAEKINKGKKTILYAIVGLVLMLFASGIGYVITDILGGSTASGPVAGPSATLPPGTRCSGTGASACSNCPSGTRAGTGLDWRSRYCL